MAIENMSQCILALQPCKRSFCNASIFSMADAASPLPVPRYIVLLGQIEDSRTNKKKRPAALSPSAYTSPSPSKKMKATTKSPAVVLEDGEIEEVADFVPEPMVQDLAF